MFSLRFSRLCLPSFSANMTQAVSKVWQTVILQKQDQLKSQIEYIKIDRLQASGRYRIKDKKKRIRKLPDEDRGQDSGRRDSRRRC